MKAIVYRKKGSPERLVLEEIEKPIPLDDQVLVKIRAVSPNAADYRSIKMGTVPKKKIFGSAIAGTVEAVGQHVRQFKPGDQVIGDLADFGFGGFAEFAAVKEKALVPMPEKMSFEVAASLPVAATTALQALRNKGNIQKGQKVLIIGGAGGVGTFAVQLAHHFGAEVTAVCSTRNIEQTKALGADFVIDYKVDDFTRQEKRYDLVVAVNGNYPLLACKRILSKNGTYVMVGGALSQIFRALLFGWLLSFGSKKIRTLAAKANQEDLSFLARLVEEGQIKPVIEQTYAFEQTAEAMRYLAEGHASGKVVIMV